MRLPGAVMWKPILGLALSCGIGIIVGYALAIVLVSGWSFSFAVRHGVWRALRAKSMMEFYERAARTEREVYALHFVNVLHEVGGPSAPVPLTKAGVENMHRLAEERMKFDKTKRWYSYTFWEDKR